MMSERKNSEELDPPPPPADDYIAPAPRVSVQAFCETETTAEAMQSAGLDRRLAKAHLTIKMGGMEAASALLGAFSGKVMLTTSDRGTLISP